MKLAVIILNWNAADDTIRCIQHIANWQTLRPTIWVVDNASLDADIEKIVHNCPGIHLIRNSTNLGYAGGNNRALEAILEQSNPFILLINNDAQIEEGALKRLLNTLEAHPQVGIVGPLLFDAEERERLLTAGGQNLVHHLTSHISTLTGEKQVQVVDYIPGTVMLIRAELFRRVGLLDEAYFFSGEIPDWCHRAKFAGYLSAINTEARAYHTVSRSSNFRETLYTYYIIRNRFLFIRKFYRASKVILFSFWTLYSLALSLKVQWEGKNPTATAIRLGLSDGLKGRFGDQNERVMVACQTPLQFQRLG